jgi:hypothetical protein
MIILGIRRMNKKFLIIGWMAALLFSGCAGLPDKPAKNDPASLRVSGDVTVCAVDRKGFWVWGPGS